MTEAVWGRYAEALYTIASDDAVLLERVGFEFGKFTEITSKFSELAVYFDHPLLELDQKYDFLKKLADEMEISDEVHGLLRSIVKRSRFASLGRILKAFKELLDEEVGSGREVRSAPEERCCWRISRSLPAPLERRSDLLSGSCRTSGGPSRRSAVRDRRKPAGERSPCCPSDRPPPGNPKLDRV